MCSVYMCRIKAWDSESTFFCYYVCIYIYIYIQFCACVLLYITCYINKWTPQANYFMIITNSESSFLIINIFKLFLLSFLLKYLTSYLLFLIFSYLMILYFVVCILRNQ